jgi:hypothetical protein
MRNRLLGILLLLGGLVCFAGTVEVKLYSDTPTPTAGKSFQLQAWFQSSIAPINATCRLNLPNSISIQPEQVEECLRDGTTRYNCSFQVSLDQTAIPLEHTLQVALQPQHYEDFFIKLDCDCQEKNPVNCAYDEIDLTAQSPVQLLIEVSDDTKYYKRGDAIQRNITVANKGEMPAKTVLCELNSTSEWDHQLMVQDFTIVGAKGTMFLASCTHNTNRIQCEMGDIDPSNHERIQLTILFNVSTAAPSDLEMTFTCWEKAAVYYPSETWGPAKQNFAIHISNEVNLLIEESEHLATSIPAGESLLLEYNVTNQGSGTATNVTCDITYPEGVSFVPNGDSWRPNSASVTYTYLGNIEVEHKVGLPPATFHFDSSLQEGTNASLVTTCQVTSGNGKKAVKEHQVQLTRQFSLSVSFSTNVALPVSPNGKLLLRAILEDEGPSDAGLIDCTWDLKNRGLYLIETWNEQNATIVVGGGSGGEGNHPGDILGMHCENLSNDYKIVCHTTAPLIAHGKATTVIHLRVEDWLTDPQEVTFSCASKDQSETSVSATFPISIKVANNNTSNNNTNTSSGHDKPIPHDDETPQGLSTLTIVMIMGNITLIAVIVGVAMWWKRRQERNAWAALAASGGGASPRFTEMESINRDRID